MGDMAWWIVLVGLAALVALVALALSRPRHAERDLLRQRFGREYARTVEETGSGRAARRELRRRMRRVSSYRLRPLDQEERERFARAARAWEAAFVDDPARSVVQLGRLVKDVMRAMGYESEGIDERVADLSVHHAAVVEDYRIAHELGRRAATGRASSEELARALARYRTVLRELLESQAEGEAHARRWRPRPVG